MPLKTCKPSELTPRIFPDAVSATLASSARAPATPKDVAARKPSEVRITVRRFGMAVPFWQAAKYSIRSVDPASVGWAAPGLPGLFLPAVDDDADLENRVDERCHV